MRSFFDSISISGLEELETNSLKPSKTQRIKKKEKTATIITNEANILIMGSAGFFLVPLYILKAINRSNNTTRLKGSFFQITIFESDLHSQHLNQ